MKTSVVLSVLAGAAAVLATPIVQARDTTTSTSATATPTNYGSYGSYGNYGSYGQYSRSAEAEAEIEALLELASKIKAKRAADVEAVAM